MVPAPGRFSTTNGCPRRSDSLAANRRASVSLPPPGGYGTIMRTGFTGYDWAAACKANSNRTPINPSLFTVPPPCEWLPPVDCVAPRADQRHRERGEEKERLQLDRPPAGLGQQKNVLHVRKPDGEEHVHHHDEGTDARIEPDDDEQGRQHLAHVRPVG